MPPSGREVAERKRGRREPGGSNNIGVGPIDSAFVRFLPAGSPSQKSKISDSPLRRARSAALTAHWAVIHYRRLRFAYPPGGGLGSGSTSPPYKDRRGRRSLP